LIRIYNELIDSYIENDIGIVNHFLDKALAENLKNNLIQLFNHHKLYSAGTGMNSIINHQKLIRTDKIYWLDKANNDPHEFLFFELMDQFIKHLNSTCFTSIKSYEFHYTLYETGSYYTKHLDQFKANDSRQFSMILYLNENWQLEDGGELRVHFENSLVNILPQGGKSVFFKSNEHLHEVMITNKPRMSITGWLKN
jgi:SM-20-related protein